jgi:hypothetical protein
MKLSTTHQEILDGFNKLPGGAGIPIPVWRALSGGRSSASTYRDMKNGLLESFTVGKNRLLRVESCRKVLAGKPA